jgi:predicted amidohydrolase YtcJ
VSGIGRRKFLAVAVGAAAAGASGTQAKSASGKPKAASDVVVYTAKKIVTMDPARSTAPAVAIAGGRIVAVGSLDEVKRALAGRAFTVDQTFADKIVMPGLIEQHLHPILAALALKSEIIANDAWVLPDRVVEAATTPQAYRKRLTDAARAAGPGEDFFFSWGFHQFWHGEISRADLDAISTARPIAVWHRSCHEFYLNTPALAALAVSEASTKGQGLASEQADWARGHFFEKGLNLILAPLMRRFASPERMVAGLTLLRTYMHRAGVTALNEPGAQIGPEQLALYQAVLGADDTPFTTTLIVDGRTMFDRHGAAGTLAATEQMIALAPEGKVRFLPKQIKFFADGAIVSQKMQMKDGYTDGHRGEWMTEPEDFKAAWKLFWDAGYQTHTHVNGDLGLDMVLDAMEASLGERPRKDHRSVIVHFANSTEAQVERIARLGAVVSANPYYVPAFADAYGKWGLGPERADNMTRLGSCVRRGVSVSLHSDMPIGPARPLFNAWAAVNRVTVSGRVAGPDQRLSVDQALRAITIEAAQSWRLDHEMGSVTAGKVANFAVLDDDPTEVDPMRLKDVKVWGTMFEGRVFPA